MIGRPVIRLDAVTSTQDVAFRLGALGAPEGMTVVARYQGAGRGRAGRVWSAPPGDALMFSVVLRPGSPSNALGPFSILVADAVAEMVAELFSLETTVKWPNDVLVGGRKLSGVLIQARGDLAVAGVGINVRTPGDMLPENATSLYVETGQVIDPRELLPDLLAKMGERYDRARKDDVQQEFGRINARLDLRGEPARIHEGTQTIEGEILRVRNDGALLMSVDGHVRAIYSGELVRGPRKDPASVTAQVPEARYTSDEVTHRPMGGQEKAIRER